MASSARNVLLGAVGLAAVLGLALGLQRSQAASLPEMFPELADLPDVGAVDIKLTWMGLSPLSPMGVAYALVLHDDRFAGPATVTVVDDSAVHQISVPRARVREFLADASKARLTETKYEARIDHTDDYPAVAVEVKGARGLLVIETESQPRRPEAGAFLDRTPWAIRYLGRTFVTNSTYLDRTLDPLVADLRYRELQSDLVMDVKSRGDKPR